MDENPIPDANQETVSKETYDAVVEKLANETQAKANLVEEIKELRGKNQLTEAETTALKEKVAQLEGIPPSSTEVTPESMVKTAEEAAQRILRNRDREEAQANRAAAMDAFLAEHKEFHPGNDEGGLKMAALTRKLERFDLSGLHSVSDFKSVFEDAKNLVVGVQPDTGNPENPNPLPPTGSGTNPKPSESTEITSKEMKIIDRSFGGDKERYLKIKAKRPDYVASLLAHSLD